jgi:hypothetical protein
MEKTNSNLESKENENEFLEHINTYSDFIKLSFRDLVTITKDDKEIFLDLYYNRDTEFNEMKSILKNIRNRGNNILITGQAGSGKSCFMYKVFYEIERLSDYNLYPIIVDYGQVENVEHLQKRFINRMIEYFSDIGHPINNIKENNDANITHNIHLLKDHLANVEFSPNTKHLVILLDDFDYIEQSLFGLLEKFMGFGIHQNVTLVLSARPSLKNSIKEYDIRLAKNFTREVHTIDLVRLDIKKLIAKRLAIVLLENQINPPTVPKSWLSKFKNEESPYMRFLRKMNIVHISELKKLQLPFTDLYLNFIRCVTDHNIREIFDIVHDSLIYVLSNYKKLEVVIEKDEWGLPVEKREIPHEVALKLFYDNQDSTFKLLNLNESKSKKGNSLLFNVLEGVKIYEELNGDFEQVMSKLGHSKKDVEFAIKKIKSPEYALIEPRRIISTEVKYRIDRFPRYLITKKGDYYLSNLAYWDEYILRCGNFGESIKEYVDTIGN